jgi:hypothetical protein
MLLTNGRGDVPSARELEEKLQIMPGQSVAVVNVPAESRFAPRPTDLAWLRSVYAAASAGRLAWVIYPKPGQPGIDLRRDWLVRALRQYGVEPVQDVSINSTWSALQLDSAKDDHPPDTSTANKDSK